MKPTTVAVTVLVAGLAVGALGGGCSSSDESSLLGDSDAGAGRRRGNDTSQDQDPTAPKEPGASDSDAATTTDGGAKDGAADAAPLPPGANKVPCGSNTCNTPTQVCCQAFAKPAVCIPANDACNDGSKTSCDAKEDCAGATICCASVYGTHCRTACDVNQSQYQICKINSECANGTCYENECTASANGAKYTVHSCLMLPGCTVK